MQPLKTYLMSLSLLLLTSACSTTPVAPVIQTKIVKQNVPVQPRPAPVKLNNIAWHVVTEENLQEFLTTFSDTGVVFFALSVEDYETLALNMSEIRRYIEQQKAIIVYYETSLSKDLNETK